MTVSDFITDFFCGIDHNGKSGDNQDAEEKACFLINSKYSSEQKAVCVNSQPEHSPEASFSVSIGDHTRKSVKRSAPRKVIPGLQIHLKRLNKRFPATDISASGVGFAFSTPRVKRGVDIIVDLYFGNALHAADLTCKVVRHENNVVGCRFITSGQPHDNSLQEILNMGQA
ncbi:protein of unknown function [Pseudodesulfovibrio profundus]|uniref:PilZ domain-containing protein n=1 Tax=Pseudodesulfovibrio profundus TaxID=57320 RepID=A0A2C8F2S1_9BACT|nr:PilZ domain-containing protein [Pseudodesulfovibrio profundus]SOB57005.1 protein of unknown function [Pseudodesulfovibrio profundus]